MKKQLALILVLTLALSLGACGSGAAGSAQTAAPAKNEKLVLGTLSMLNMTEEEYTALVDARMQSSSQMVKEGYAQELAPRPSRGDWGNPSDETEIKVIFYESLDALLMALNAGEIRYIELYQSVARYLCANNDSMTMLIRYDPNKTPNTFVELVQSGFNGNDFAFLMTESNAPLRDEFNAVIAGMKADGTLDRLVEQQIDALIEGGEIRPIELPRFDGAETIRIAVTGALPPMDYVAPDGTPAGFNTAVLAEIGSRLGKNIELVVVDSLGRAAALAGGVVDAVFWTRTSSQAQKQAAMTQAERQAHQAQLEAGMTEEEIKLLQEVSESIDFSSYGTADMPEGTIATDPYYADVFVMVGMSR